MEADETTIKDGDHILCLYKCEDSYRLKDANVYLPLPSKLSQIPSSDNQITLSQGFVRSIKENVTVKTRLCSTKLTQNGNPNFKYIETKQRNYVKNISKWYAIKINIPLYILKY